MDEHGNVAKYYSHFYSQMIGMESTGLLALLWKFPHKLMEKPFKTNEGYRILELGAGQGEHIQFVVDNYSEYVALDLDVERLLKISSTTKERLSLRCGDATTLDFSDRTFDRIIATCLLAHLKEPEAALHEWRRVLKPSGKITIYVPCEPGLALRVFRSLFTRPKAAKLGFQGYDLFIARDHLNSAANLRVLLAHVFKGDNISYHFIPFRFRSWYLNLFFVVQISKLGD